MAYVKPGVEVRQEQRSNTPVLITPDLEACVVGHSYIWVDPSSEESILPLTKLTSTSVYTGTVSSGVTTWTSTSAMTTNLSSYFTYADVAGDQTLVVVDLLGIKGTDTGKVKHLKYGYNYSVASNGIITYSGTSCAVDSEYQIRVGLRAKNTKVVQGVVDLLSISDAEDTLGKAVSFNPLGYGAYLTMTNSNKAIKALKVNLPNTGVAGALDIINAINNYLPTEEVYIIAPVSDVVSADSLCIHCEAQSEPAVKKERIAFTNKVVGYTGNPKDASTFTSSLKVAKAESIRDANSAHQSKRLFSVHPDAAYVTETRHISTLTPAWIQKSFDSTTTITFATYNLFAKLISDTVVNSVTYKAGTLITSALWETLYAAGWGGDSGMVYVKVPVPGYYYSAATAGLGIGTPVSQPLTNVPVAGFVETFGSQDVFAESILNTMAEGGTWVMTQASSQSPLVSRHQMSTDITSIAKREFSVTKAIDFTAKFIRKSLSPYIGRYNITDNYLKLVKMILGGVGKYLVSEGNIAAFTVDTVEQSVDAPDTILVTVSVKPLYPVNYIKITLVF